MASQCSQMTSLGWGKVGIGGVLPTDVGDLSECPIWAHPDTSVGATGNTPPNPTAPNPDPNRVEGRYPFKSMEVGASFPVDDDAVPSVRSQASKMKANLVGFYAVRRTSSGWRCFRLA